MEGWIGVPSVRELMVLPRLTDWLVIQDLCVGKVMGMVVFSLAKRGREGKGNGWRR